jgi:phosphatidylglycerophosphatase C
MVKYGPMHIAVFDLDGTITRRDTLFPYVMGVCLRHPARLLRVLAKMPGALLRYAFQGRDRGRLKETLIVSALRGLTRKELGERSQRFVQRLAQSGMYPEALACIAEHQRRGDYLVLMSASPDIYVPVVARTLGFAETICTGVRWDGMALDGELITENRRGEEKVRCLQGLRQRYPRYKVSAYGNSASDVPHLKLCEGGHLVNGDDEAIREAARANVSIGWPHASLNQKRP